MKITELIPGKKVVWHVLESQMDNFEGGLSGMAQNLFLKSQKRRTKPKSGSLIWDWYQNLNVILSVQQPGIFILRVVYRD